MATTPNLNLPLIDENTVNDVPRDFNALAEAVDTAVTEAIEGVTVPDASLTQKGIVQLSNATNGTRENVAPTEKALGEVMKEALAGKQLGVEQKANVVAALNSIGVPASTSETWVQLIPKIAAIIRASGNATAADLLVGKSASNASGPFNGGMPNRSAENEHMPGLASTVWAGDRFFIQPPHGYFNGFSWVTAAVPGLTANNLRAGVSVAGLVGELVEGLRYIQGQVTLNAENMFVIPFVPSQLFDPGYVLLWRVDPIYGGNIYLAGFMPVEGNRNGTLFTAGGGSGPTESKGTIVSPTKPGTPYPNTVTIIISRDIWGYKDWTYQIIEKRLT